jgi:hypothetical protein
MGAELTVILEQEVWLRLDIYRMFNQRQQLLQWDPSGDDTNEGRAPIELDEGRVHMRSDLWQ